MGYNAKMCREFAVSLAQESGDRIGKFDHCGMCSVHNFALPHDLLLRMSRVRTLTSLGGGKILSRIPYSSSMVKFSSRIENMYFHLFHLISSFIASSKQKDLPINEPVPVNWSGLCEKNQCKNGDRACSAWHFAAILRSEII